MNWPGDDRDNDYSDGSIQPTNKNNSYDLNSKIMLTAVISLSFVVTLVVILHIYARYVLRRNTRRAAALRRQLGLVAQSNNEQEPKRGLDPLIISSLPIFTFKKVNGQDSFECAVCLSLLENEEIARVLPNCKHSFHAECIDKWLSSHSTCPICRTEAEPMAMPQPEPREGPVTSGAVATAPLLEGIHSSSTNESSTKASGSTRLNSLRRMISTRDRSSRRVNQSEDGVQDLEMQQ
ncbi:hypothetical protein ACFE04_030584 [Oxalis oulophora]